MSTHQTAKTLHATIPSGAYLAYRRLGTHPGTPLLILTHFRGVMDKYDPLLINTLSQHRRLILVDYAGVGLSTGTVATSARQSAADILSFLDVTGERELDVLGFSLGGMVAQLVALNADPSKVKVRKLVLAGTTPSIGEGVLRSPNADVFEVAGAKDVTVETFKKLFFVSGTREGDAAVEQWWARIHERSVATSGEEPATWLSQGYADGAEGLKAQSQQLASWMTAEGSKGDEGSFERLAGLNIPVLVVNGHVSVKSVAALCCSIITDTSPQDDYMVPTFNSFTMQQKLPNAELIIYPNSSHGAIFQYASYFAQHVQAFLSS
jgi:pimeloyl-ACP methyl ester carboxylesterase